MTRTAHIILRKKIATLLLVTVSVAAFATLGDGKKADSSGARLLTKPAVSSNNFSLKSGYNFRGNSVFSTQNEKKFIVLNTTVSIQKGNSTYVMPLKRKVLLDKVKFSPSR